MIKILNKLYFRIFFLFFCIFQISSIGYNFFHSVNEFLFFYWWWVFFLIKGKLMDSSATASQLIPLERYTTFTDRKGKLKTSVISVQIVQVRDS